MNSRNRAGSRNYDLTGYAANDLYAAASRRWKQSVTTAHPDTGGNASRCAALNATWTRAKALFARLGIPVVAVALAVGCAIDKPSRQVEDTNPSKASVRTSVVEPPTVIRFSWQSNGSATNHRFAYGGGSRMYSVTNMTGSAGTNYTLTYQWPDDWGVTFYSVAALGNGTNSEWSNEVTMPPRSTNLPPTHVLLSWAPSGTVSVLCSKTCVGMSKWSVLTNTSGSNVLVALQPGRWFYALRGTAAVRLRMEGVVR